MSIVGSAELTNDETEKVRTFVDIHALEHSPLLVLKGRLLWRAIPQMYCVYPHAEPYPPEDDGRYSRTRFSCAGFVFEAYKEARIHLLNVSELPSVGMPEIQSTYHEHIAFLERVGVSLESLGLVGPGPWAVMFCGYLFHSLSRENAAIREAPFIPRVVDRYFREDTSDRFQYAYVTSNAKDIDGQNVVQVNVFNVQQMAVERFSVRVSAASASANERLAFDQLETLAEPVPTPLWKECSVLLREMTADPAQKLREALTDRILKADEPLRLTADVGSWPKLAAELIARPTEYGLGFFQSPLGAP